MSFSCVLILFKKDEHHIDDDVFLVFFLKSNSFISTQVQAYMSLAEKVLGRMSAIKEPSR